MKEWRAKNPDYQKRWRAKRREIQDEIVAKSRVKSLAFNIPAAVLESEIQDVIRLNLPVVVRSYRGVARQREIQPEIELLSPSIVTKSS